MFGHAVGPIGGLTGLVSLILTLRDRRRARKAAADARLEEAAEWSRAADFGMRDNPCLR